MKRNHLLFIGLATLLLPSLGFSAEGWFVRPYVGLSQMSDQTATTTGVGALDGEADIELGTGFQAGFSGGYRYNEDWAIELAWEYRSNESETTLADGTQYTEGNYASNLFFVNGLYFFDAMGKWEPYVGAGLSWGQEVDIDLETAGTELSYSGSGDLGYQLFAGVNYPVAEQWYVQGELRYGSTTGLELEGEEAAVGQFSELDYQPITVQAGLVYYFK